MAYGVEIYDSTGALQVDLGSRIAKLLLMEELPQVDSNTCTPLGNSQYLWQTRTFSPPPNCDLLFLLSDSSNWYVTFEGNTLSIKLDFEYYVNYYRPNGTGPTQSYTGDYGFRAYPTVLLVYAY